jgi:hypothetical protein
MELNSALPEDNSVGVLLKLLMLKISIWVKHSVRHRREVYYKSEDTTDEITRSTKVCTER